LSSQNGNSNGNGNPPAHRLALLEANVGNLPDSTGESCPGEPYEGGICSREQIRVIRARIDALDPDVAILVEVPDLTLCAGHTDGASDFTCTGWTADQPQTLRRLVGDGYTILCDGIAHYDCIAVRSTLPVAECPAGGTCIGQADTPAWPASCAHGVGTISSVSRVHVTLPDGPLLAVIMHPLNASTPETDPCRADEDAQAFDVLAQGGRALLAGDWNFDPYRLPTLWRSGPLFFEHVGEGKRFHANSVDDEANPTPTWVGLATLDYVVTDFAQGGCTVLGETPGTERLDAPVDRMDHRALTCDLAW
jgi:hypothetical protein